MFLEPIVLDQKGKLRISVTDRQKEIERLGARLDPALRAFIDRAIVPALVREIRAEQKEADSLKFRPVSDSPANELSAEVSQ